MGNRPENERDVRILMHGTNGSYTITLPVEHIHSLGWKANQKVIVKKVGNEIVVKDWKKD